MTMTTATLKPRPVRKKYKTTTYKPMTEQTSTPHIVNKVQSHRPDIYLIERDALWHDMQQRIKIHNYEVKTALEDLKKVVKQTKELYSKATTTDTDK